MGKTNFGVKELLFFIFLLWISQINLSQGQTSRRLSGIRSDPVKIQPLGNSITQAEKGHNSYRRPLWHMTQAAGWNVDFVGSEDKLDGGDTPPNPDYDQDHEGHWGWTAAELAEDLPTWLQDYTPDAVLLHAGHNDLKASGSDNTVIQNTFNNLEDIINILRNDNPNVTIFLAQLIPSTLEPRAHRIPIFNDQVPAFAAGLDEPDSPIIVVDQYTGFNVNTDTYDGTHPSPSGEQKMAQKWFDALAGSDLSLPVTLTSFAATAGNGFVELKWVTESEVNNDAFILERSTAETEFTPIAEIPGQGNTNARHEYSYVDYDVQNNVTYYYRLADRDFNGVITYHNVVSATPVETMPDALASIHFNLLPNFPNPFNGQTTIQFEVITDGNQSVSTDLSVYNVSGQLVRKIITGELVPGNHRYNWDGQNDNGIEVSSGMYILVLRSGSLMKTQQMVLVR